MTSKRFVGVTLIRFGGGGVSFFFGEDFVSLPATLRAGTVAFSATGVSAFLAKYFRALYALRFLSELSLNLAWLGIFPEVNLTCKVRKMGRAMP